MAMDSTYENRMSVASELAQDLGRYTARAVINGSKHFLDENGRTSRTLMGDKLALLRFAKEWKDAGQVLDKYNKNNDLDLVVPGTTAVSQDYRDIIRMRLLPIQKMAGLAEAKAEGRNDISDAQFEREYSRAIAQVTQNMYDEMGGRAQTESRTDPDGTARKIGFSSNLPSEALGFMGPQDWASLMSGDSEPDDMEQRLKRTFDRQRTNTTGLDNLDDRVDAEEAARRPQP